MQKIAQEYFQGSMNAYLLQTQTIPIKEEGLPRGGTSAHFLPMSNKKRRARSYDNAPFRIFGRG